MTNAGLRSVRTVLTSALSPQDFRDLAEIIGTELVVIDSNATPDSVRRQLRRNAAYHRLAARL